MPTPPEGARSARNAFRFRELFSSWWEHRASFFISVAIALSWRGDSDKGQVKLPELQLAPFATQQLQIWAMQKQLGIPDDAHWGLVSLTTNASPDDVIAIASSRDCTGVYNAETKFSGGLGGYFAGGEWRLDAIHNRIAAITNVGTEPAEALLTLHYDNGAKKYELQQTIAPGDQMCVNLAQLIRGRVADRLRAEPNRGCRTLCVWFIKGAGLESTSLAMIHQNSRCWPGHYLPEPAANPPYPNMVHS
jgi:hypothetical protein